MAKKPPSNSTPRIINRRAHHDYHFVEKLEVGIVLSGSEVKSVRNGQVSIGQGYARVETNGLYLYDVDIALYPHAGPNQHNPKRRRKLLAHKHQIAHLADCTTSKGITLIPVAMYFVRGHAKLEVAVASGKRSYDKRQVIKKRETDREMRRAMTRKVI